MSAKVITHRVRVKTLKLATAKNRAVIVEHSAKSGNAAAILCRMEVEVSRWEENAYCIRNCMLNDLFV